MFVNPIVKYVRLCRRRPSLLLLMTLFLAPCADVLSYEGLVACLSAMSCGEGETERELKSAIDVAALSVSFLLLFDK